ncbi:MAG: peptide deformylase [Rhodobacteraceae bacterium]|nr:peptide deformylase [Paracoccaceae bacterium]
MAVLPILRWPDERLETRCAPVTGDVAALAADMLETMYAAPGRGLAAPQVGVLLRLFVMDATWKQGVRAPQVMVNPAITWRAPQRVWGEEGCLSLPGVTARVERAKEIRLRWSELDGSAREETLTGFAAICAQHEYDHLDGILTLDRISPAERAAAEEALQ